MKRRTALVVAFLFLALSGRAAEAKTQRDFSTGFHFGTPFLLGHSGDSCKITQSVIVGMSAVTQVTGWVYSGTQVNVQYWNTDLIGYRTVYHPDLSEPFSSEPYHKDFSSISIVGIVRAYLWPNGTFSPFAELGAGTVIYAEPRGIENIVKKGRTGDLSIRSSFLMGLGNNFGPIGVKAQLIKGGDWSWLALYFSMNR